MNPVHLEMIKIHKKWYQELKANPDSITYVLLGERYETQLFETYFKYQLSDEALSDDIFMIHYQKFNSPLDYGQVLVEEWQSVFREWKTFYNEELEWKIPAPEKNIKNDAEICVKALSSFIGIFPHLRERKIFLHIAPIHISNNNDLENWLIDCGKYIEKYGLGDIIKLVYTDHINYRTINNFYRSHIWNFPIDINDLMEKTANHSGQIGNNPENDFQQIILKASNSISKEKYEEADILLEKAIIVAKRKKLLQGEVMALLIMAQNNFAQGKYHTTKKLYETAIHQSETHPSLQVQVYYSFASFLLSQSQKSKALDIFMKTIEIGQNIDDIFIQIEGYRLLGQLHHIENNGTKAIFYYENAIKLSDKLEINDLRESSIPYIATLLIDLYGTDNQNSHRIDLLLKEKLGDSWKDLVKIPEEVLKMNKENE